MMSSVLCLLLFSLCMLPTALLQSSLPNIVFVLTDDLGYNSPGYNNPTLDTPTLDSLAADGLVLEQHYTYKFCAPSRGSFLTGRYPFKLSATRCNYIPIQIPDGINLNFTMLPRKLSQAGYVSHHIGKWHQGFFAPEYLPVSRGFNSSFGFLEGGEDHYTSATFDSDPCTKPYDKDLYNNTAPAYGRAGTYTGYQFNDAAVDVINNHDVSKPMFMYLALHNTHAPTEAPENFVNKYNSSLPLENTYDGMISVVDSTVFNVTEALKAKGMWDNTLFVWTSDNGAPIQVAGSNYPLRGGKGSNWEGGIHTRAFVNGGFLPTSQQGASLPGMMHILDWYATFCSIAGVDPEDPSGPSPIDSIDMWPYISGTNTTEPRTDIVYDHNLFDESNPTGSLRMGHYKLIVGGSNGEQQASWYGEFSPNTTHVNITYATCFAETPCVFNISADPTEHNDISAEYESITQSLVNWFNLLKKAYHPPVNNPPIDRPGYCAAAVAHQGYIAPWRENPYIPSE